MSVPGLFARDSAAAESQAEYPVGVRGSVCSGDAQVTRVTLADRVAKVVYLGVPKQA